MGQNHTRAIWCGFVYMAIYSQNEVLYNMDINIY